MFKKLLLPIFNRLRIPKKKKEKIKYNCICEDPKGIGYCHIHKTDWV